MRKTVFIAILTILVATFAVSAAGASAEDIKTRMIERLPAIKALKDKGFVGENNLGYLEFIGNQKENQDLIDAENNDRRLVYEAIAKQQSTTIELVGKHRAIQIAEKAQPGDWLQDATGKWYQKK